jgi:hypothetical protein
MKLEGKILKQFSDLTYRLSPENIACDGEISNGEADSRYSQAMREWEALERKLGRKVSECQVYDAEDAERAKA